MPALSRALECAVAAARAAGDILRAELHRPGGPRGADGKAPADTEAELEIRRRLREAFPTDGYLGEETGAEPAARGETSLWLVDPNDGTRAFLRGHRGTAVSIARLRDRVPVLGVVYAFAAPDDRGDLIAWAEGGPMLRNGEPIARPAWPLELDRQSVVLVSDGADERPAVNAALVAPARFRAQESIAYRLALAAAGEGAAAVSIHAPGAWDYAGGHALLAAAGGVLLDERGREVRYAEDGRSRTRFCFGGAPRVAAELARRDWAVIERTPRVTPEPYDLVALEPGRLHADPARLSRAQGCLLGQIAGDAIGSFVALESPAAPRGYDPGGDRQLEHGGVGGTLAGQPTPDGELALVLARAIVQAGGYEPQAAARAYHYWFRSGPSDCDRAIRRALGGLSGEEVASGRAARAARRAADPASQAIGVLVRASPIGVWGWRLAPRELAAVARADAALTHAHPACGDAAAALVIAIAHGLASSEGPEAMYARAREWAATFARDRAVATALDAAAHEPPRDVRARAGRVIVALQDAFYRLLHAPSLEEAIMSSAAAGGDTATTAAVAGALAGAAHGREAVPRAWRRAILTCRPIAGLPGVERPRPRACWPVDVPELAERLLAG